MYRILTLNLNEMSAFCRGCCDGEICLVTDTGKLEKPTSEEATEDAMNESVLYGGHRQLPQEVHAESVRGIVIYIRLQYIKEMRKEILARVADNPDLLAEVRDRLKNDEIVY